MKIELGCGPEDRRRKGYIGIDVADMGQEYVLDLEKDKLPFKDNSVDTIYSSHVIEHLRDVQLCLNECWRVLKDDGYMEVIVPYGLWEGASKPVHFQSITECWFDFLTKDKTKHYGYKRWEIEQMSVREKDGEKYEIYCKMKKWN